jgi:hypothetical protein
VSVVNRARMSRHDFDNTDGPSHGDLARVDD